MQGDIVKILDEGGNEKASYVYNAWGDILSQSEDELSSINPLRYRGYVYDEDTTLYYLQTRYYDPQTGRFINADDTAFIGSSVTFINGHAFCITKDGKKLKMLNYQNEDRCAKAVNWNNIKSRFIAAFCIK